MGRVRRRGSLVRVDLEPVEAGLLASLARQVVDLLGGDPEPSEDPLQRIVGMPTAQRVAAPEDPVLRRLLPDGYADDPDAANEFRRLTDNDLRAEKVAALEQVLDSLDGTTEHEVRVELNEPDAELWLHALADVRLALGTRLDVTEEMTDQRHHLPPEDPRAQELMVYDWLSWLQESLVEAVSG
jgi:hypothetical protein